MTLDIYAGFGRNASPTFACSPFWFANRCMARYCSPKFAPLTLRKLHISPKPRRQQKEVGEI